MYIQNTEILLHLQTVPDQTGRQDREKGAGRGGECAACRGGEVFSQRISTGRSWIHARTGGRGQRRVPALAVCGWQGARSLCLPDPVPWSLFFRLQPKVGGSGWGRGPAGTTGQRGREVTAPWSLLWKTEACLVCPSSCLWLAWSILPPSPPHPEAHWTQEEQAQQPGFKLPWGGGGQMVQLDSCSS